MISAQITFCKSCKARCRWAKTKKNQKWILVDSGVKRVHHGDPGCYVLEDGSVVHGKNVQDDCWGYIAHFATCPNAKDHRK